MDSAPFCAGDDRLPERAFARRRCRGEADAAGSRFQSRGSISQPLLVDQQGKLDPRFLAEKPSILAVPQSDGGQLGSLFLEFFLVLAQLRDVFTTENSAVVPQKNEHRRTARPQRPENYFPSIAIRKSEVRQCGAKLFHDVSVLSTASRTVKLCGHSVL